MLIIVTLEHKIKKKNFNGLWIKCLLNTLEFQTNCIGKIKVTQGIMPCHNM